MAEPLILVRALHFAATLLAAGIPTFLVLVAPRLEEPLRRPLVRLTWAALAIAILSGGIWLVLLASDIFGEPLLAVCLHGGAWSVLTDTRFGQMLCVRLLLAVIVAWVVARPALGWLKLATAAVFAALPAWTGHAGAGLGAAGSILVATDTIHLLAAAAWLGGLPALAMTLSKARHGSVPTVARILARFSTLGMISVAALLTSGLVNSWNLLGSPLNLMGSGYGRLLLLKLGLFLAMVAVAAVNRLHLTPRLSENPVLGALVRNSLAEIGLGLGILFLVGALGTVPPSAHVHRGLDIPPEAAYVHIHTVDVMADLIISPGRATQTRATIRLSREDGSEFPAKFVRLLLETLGSAQPLQADARRGPDGAWEVPDLTLGAPGTWTAKVIVGTEGGRNLVLDAPVLIEP